MSAQGTSPGKDPQRLPRLSLIFGLAVLLSGFCLNTATSNDSAFLRIAAAESEKPAAEKGHKDKDADAQPMPEASEAPKLSPADQYCSNVQSAASSAQAAQQRKSLAQAQQEIDKRVKLLTERTDEYQKWLKKREDFVKLASDSLMRIYSTMKPEAASAQLIAMNELVAAAIVLKLPAKSASAILAEMDSGRAAKLSAVIASAGEIGERKAAPEGDKR